MSDLCTDNRFELIEKYKQKLIECTNIESAPDEMAVLDNILFRFWQMEWLDKLDLPSAQPEIVRCKDCKFGNISSMGHLAVCGHEKGLVDPVPDSYCSYAERRTDE